MAGIVTRGRRALLAGGLGLVGLLVAASSAQAAPAYAKTIIINAGQVSGGPLASFPFLFNTTDPDLRTTANGGRVENANGWDIVFAATPTCADSMTCKRDHEIESYNPTTGQLIAWVRVPSIDNGTLLYLHYGDAAVAASTENRTGVWDANYRGVWHLRESANPVADSTGNANNGTLENSPTQTAGAIDGSLQFDGTLDRDVLVPHSASLQLPTDMTVSGWARTTSVDGQARLIVAKRRTAPGANYWHGKLNASTVNFGVDGGPTAGAPLGLVNDGLWHLVVGVNDTAANVLRVYVDGTERATNPYTGPSQTGTSELRVGRSPDATLQDWAGGLDEVRVSSTARSAGWIRTEYNNQRSPSTFYRLGPVKLIGFETQDASEIVSLGAGASIDLATVRPGSGQASLQQSTGATVLTSGLNPALSALGLRFSFRKPSNPAANQTLLLFMAGATNQWALQLRPDGRLQVQDLAALTFGTTTGSTALADATWYTVRLAYNAAGGACCSCGSARRSRSAPATRLPARPSTRSRSWPRLLSTTTTTST